MSTRDRLIATSFAVALLTGAAGAAPTPTAATAATVDAKLAEVRGAVYARKSASLKAVMRLDAAQQAKFDPLLAAYDAELKKLGERHATVIKEFAGYHDAKSLDDANATRLVNETFKIKREQLDLLDRTYGLVSKAIGVRKAAEWLQLEYSFMTAVEAKISMAMPVLSDAMKE
jgi:hypothetical protein